MATLSLVSLPLPSLFSLGQVASHHIVKTLKQLYGEVHHAEELKPQAYSHGRDSWWHRASRGLQPQLTSCLQSPKRPWAWITSWATPKFLTHSNWQILNVGSLKTKSYSDFFYTAIECSLLKVPLWHANNPLKSNRLAKQKGHRKNSNKKTEGLILPFLSPRV